MNDSNVRPIKARRGRLAGRCLVWLSCLLPSVAPAQMVLLEEASGVDERGVSETLSNVNSKKWADIDAAQRRYNSPEAQERRRQVAQDEANRKLVDELKKAQEKAAACAREKARNGGNANFWLTHCN